MVVRSAASAADRSFGSASSLGVCLEMAPNAWGARVGYSGSQPRLQTIMQAAHSGGTLATATAYAKCLQTPGESVPVNRVHPVPLEVAPDTPSLPFKAAEFLATFGQLLSDLSDGPGGDDDDDDAAAETHDNRTTRADAVGKWMRFTLLRVLAREAQSPKRAAVLLQEGYLGKLLEVSARPLTEAAAQGSEPSGAAADESPASLARRTEVLWDVLAQTKAVAGLPVHYDPAVVAARAGGVGAAASATAGGDSDVDEEGAAATEAATAVPQVVDMHPELELVTVTDLQPAVRHRGASEPVVSLRSAHTHFPAPLPSPSHISLALSLPLVLSCAVRCVEAHCS